MFHSSLKHAIFKLYKKRGSPLHLFSSKISFIFIFPFSQSFFGTVLKVLPFSILEVGLMRVELKQREPSSLSMASNSVFNALI